jgi:hypothetical protein
MAGRGVQRVAAIVAGLHLAGVVATAFYVAQSSEGQAPLVWVYWAFIDLPWSLAYLLQGPGYGSWVEAHSGGHPLIAQLLYFPHLLHGIIGTVWWYFLVLLIGKLVGAVRNRLGHSHVL